MKPVFLERNAAVEELRRVLLFLRGPMCIGLLCWIRDTLARSRLGDGDQCKLEYPQRVGIDSWDRICHRRLLGSHP